MPVAVNAFGNTTLLIDGSTGNPYRYTGRRYDPETGLYYYRARMYSPELGRFLQPDPIGYADGMNMYAYVGNNSINMVDPMGLWADWVLDMFGGAGGMADVVSDDIVNFENNGFADYTNDVRETLIGEAIGVANVGKGVYDTVTHPVQAAEAAAEGVISAVKHPIQTTQALMEGLLKKGEILIGDDPRASGIVIGEGAGQAALAAVGAKAGGALKAKLGGAGKAGGLTTPNKFFGSKTVRQANKALNRKYGKPLHSKSYKNAYYNTRSRRIFTVHNEPGHGGPHVDFNRKGFKNYRTSVPLRK